MFDQYLIPIVEEVAWTHCVKMVGLYPGTLSL